jgi:arsenite-transporting ATPase
MRTLLVTGPGGSGRTTLAAATAVQAARHGTRTLLLTADATDTAGTALGTPTGPAPVTPVPGLTVQRPDPAAGFRAGLLALQRHAGSALDLLGASPLDGDEITPLPGSAELALLGALRAAAMGPYDLVVVDLPAIPAALATLVLPEQLRRYLRRLLPQQRQAASALRPVLGRLAGVPMPAAGLYEAAGRWDTELALVQSVIEDPATTVCLVAEPGEAGAEAVRTGLAGLALYGLRCDALIANRLLPTSTTDSWLAGLAAQQHKTLDDWALPHGAHGADGGLRPALYGIPHLGRDPRGLDDLAALTASPEKGLPAGVRPAGAWPGPGAPEDGALSPWLRGAAATPAPVPWPITDRRAESGVLVWHVPLPGALREELDLIRRGDELVITAGPFRRIVDLPSALRRCTVDGAGLTGGELCIRFRPDPALWPQGR